MSDKKREEEVKLAEILEEAFRQGVNKERKQGKVPWAVEIHEELKKKRIENVH